MVTIAHLTKKLIQDKPFIHEALEKDLINVVALAELIKPDIEKELGKVKASAISMAIRRYIEKSKKNIYAKIKLVDRADILIKSNLIEISLLKSPTLYKKLMKLYDLVDYSVGDTLNIIQGNYEILIVCNKKYEKQFLNILKGEKIKTMTRDMASLSMKIPREMIDAPGYYFVITKTLALNNISIRDIVNTETEATFIFKDKDVSRAFEILKNEISVEYYKK